jgi:ADP-L-glycero-D-manno-heptose 6-epimerase
MIAITGAAGFIGRNLYEKYKSTHKIILVDFLEKFDSITAIENETMDPFEFLKKLKDKSFAQQIELIFHQGACSSTMIYDPSYMMKHNFDYSSELLRSCIQFDIRLIYASSASVYGDGPFEENTNLTPKNVYANSKRLFDNYVESFLQLNSTQIVGLRYFNVYGPFEENKNKMASVVCQFKKQIDETGEIKVFKNSENYLRDFIFVEDIVNINDHFLKNRHLTGIFNAGTGKAESFMKIVEIMSQHYNFKINKIDMPPQLVPKYQTFTQSDNNKLLSIAKYDKPFSSLREGLEKYFSYWKQSE